MCIEEDLKVASLLNIEFALTFNLPLLTVSLYDVVNPDTFNDDNNITLLLKVESALIFNIPKREVLFEKVVKQYTFNDDNKVVLPFKIEIPEIFNQLVFKAKYLVKHLYDLI